ncbi:amidohydrolase family protein [Helicobacter sp. MIT 14-3879]|uniref:amidohydrolase family protein n=1 Tax=Helicobacter sp. MIT 14-3879 TaxID=2040649 RepID=UPI000E1E68E8|nr:amidohydrolase family protein [Helicobacter sp. MIT 14-3879]RDU63124.1 dihydroorotase [Helicobacter sp. MIT 14-3879]
MILKNANNISELKIQDGLIADSTNDTAILDCKNYTLIPQFIDLNVFPKNKSLSRNSLISLSKKAKNGGVGIIALNSDTNPKIDNEMAIEFIKNLDNDIEILPLMASNNAQNKICDISILNSLGGVGINLDSIQCANTIDKIAKYAKMLDIPIFVNADDKLGGVINYGEISSILGLQARNPLSEIKEVAKILEVAVFYNIKVIFSAISEIRSIELINTAKRHNSNIFAEVSIHHLVLSDEACNNYNTSAKINPPLKDNKTKDLLLDSLQSGKIDLLTSLQCACYNSKKEQVFNDAEFGIDAIYYYFSLLYTYLVKTRVISLEQLINICAKNPAKILNLNCGGIDIGKEAKLMLIDLDSNYDIKDLLSPYNGKKLNGIVKEFI